DAFLDHDVDLGIEAEAWIDSADVLEDQGGTRGARHGRRGDTTSVAPSPMESKLVRSMGRSRETSGAVRFCVGTRGALRGSQFTRVRVRSLKTEGRKQRLWLTTAVRRTKGQSASNG